MCDRRTGKETQITVFDPGNHPHRRLNPLTREWVLVSPHRTKRPWQGQTETSPSDVRLTYDPKCYLCPGNARAEGKQNPRYEHTFVFDNDFSALLPDPVCRGRPAPHSLLQAEPVRGVCRVVCFSPRHDLTLAEMSVPDIRHVVDAWVEQTLDLGAKDFVHYVQVFENRGAMMGCSNPHPHCQVWATEQIPNEPAIEAASQQEYLEKHGRSLLTEYLHGEWLSRERLVCANDHWVALVPFWAAWPFETMLIPRRAVASLPDLNDTEQDALAEILKRLTTRYDNLFEVSFPYSMGWHQEPTDGEGYPGWILHAHFYPPLLRSASIRKFMVGFEMLAEPQRDITPEQAAERLREQSEKHYREG